MPWGSTSELDFLLSGLHCCGGDPGFSWVSSWLRGVVVRREKRPSVPQVDGAVECKLTGEQRVSQIVFGMGWE